MAVNAAQTAIERSGLKASDIDWVLPAGFSDSFTLGVSRELGIAQERHFGTRCPRAPLERGPLLSLMRLRATLPQGKTATALLWDAALCGTAGAIVAEIQAGA